MGSTDCKLDPKYPALGLSRPIRLPASIFLTKSPEPRERLDNSTHFLVMQALTAVQAGQA